MQIATEKIVVDPNEPVSVKVLEALVGSSSLLSSGCGWEGCSPICSKCTFHNPELCCMADEYIDEYPEEVKKACLMPKFICGWINRGKPATLEEED